MAKQIDNPAPSADPDAPARHTLPSGKVVEVRSHRTMLGADVAQALAAYSGQGMEAVVSLRNELTRILVTEIEPGRAGTPPLDGTLEAVLAQRADDYRKLYELMVEAWQLVLGLSVIPDFDGYDDPKAPTQDTGDSKPDSEGEPPQ